MSSLTLQRRELLLLGMAAASGVLIVLWRSRRRRAITINNKPVTSRAAVLKRLEAIMCDRYPLPKGTLASELEDHPTLSIPATVGVAGTAAARVLLGDLGTVEQLLEQSGSPRVREFMSAHPISAVLVCMGAAAAKAVSREFDKRGLVYEGLGDCVDQEGYPILERHLATSVGFIRAQLDSSAESGGCVLVHCHEGKNRSACLAVAFLMVEARVPLTEAVEHVWRQRPIVLDNRSFVAQLVDLAEREGLLS